MRISARRIKFALPFSAAGAISPAGEGVLDRLAHQARKPCRADRVGRDPETAGRGAPSNSAA